MFEPKIEFATTKEEIAKLCKLANENHLHRYGAMRYWYDEPEKLAAVSVAFDGDVPIGACTLLKKEEFTCGGRYNVGVFVTHEMRQMGVGKKLVQTIREYQPGRLYTYMGDEAAYKFWDKVDI